MVFSVVYKKGPVRLTLKVQFSRVRLVALGVDVRNESINLIGAHVLIPEKVNRVIHRREYDFHFSWRNFPRLVDIIQIKGDYVVLVSL